MEMSTSLTGSLSLCKLRESLCVCMYVHCMYIVCMYVCMYMYIGWYIHAYTRTHTNVHMHTHTAQTPTLSLLQETLSGTGVVKKWYQFGLALKQDGPKLHRVEKTCRGKPPMQHLSEMLKGWLEKGDSSVTWGAIVTALKEIDEGELAGQVREQYG